MEDIRTLFPSNRRFLLATLVISGVLGMLAAVGLSVARRRLAAAAEVNAASGEFRLRREERFDVDHEPVLLDLLAEASGKQGAELDRLARTSVPALDLVTKRISGQPVAFAAFTARSDQVTIEYLAVHESWRGRGFGTELVRDVARRHPGRAVVAETDDDAVEFYRRLGFRVERRGPDERWPGRQRYLCVLDHAI